MIGKCGFSFFWKIKYLTYLSCVLPVLFGSCATVESERSLTEFSRYADVGIAPFYHPSDPQVGWKVARAVGEEFSEKSYHVLDRGLVQSAMGDGNPWSRGLTPSGRRRFLDLGIQALVIGAVNRYGCEPHLGRGPHYLYSCYVSLSCMMFDLDTGEDVWTAGARRSRQGAYLTEETVFRELLQQLSVQIPSAKSRLPKP